MKIPGTLHLRSEHRFELGPFQPLKNTIVHDAGTNIVSNLAFASLVRFADATDGIILDMNAEIGDDQQGAAVTYGDIAGDRSGAMAPAARASGGRSRGTRHSKTSRGGWSTPS